MGGGIQWRRGEFEEHSESNWIQLSESLCRTQWFHPTTVRVSHIPVMKTHSHDSKRLQTTVLRKKGITRQRPHTFQRRTITRIHPSQMSYTLQQLAHKHTLVRWVCCLMAARSESEKLTSPANTVHPVWTLSEAESSSENSRCSPHHKCDLQSENFEFVFPQWGQCGSKTDLRRNDFTQLQFLLMYIHHQPSKLN